MSIKTALAKVLGRGSALRKWLGVDRRWGVMANGGSVTRAEFETERQARDWALRCEPALQNWETYYEDPEDRLLPAVCHIAPAAGRRRSH